LKALKEHNVNDDRKALYRTALAANMPLIPDDKCCRLLAWLYVYGGNNEQVVFDGRLNNAIFYAQHRLNLFGGELPDAELVSVLQEYIKSVEDYSNPPEWVADLEKEFGIKAYGRHKK
jgi:hypothetical protein